MTIRRLTNVGPTLTFELQPSTIPVVESLKPLVVVGVAKYLIDIFDADGELNTEAQLTGPAVIASAFQDTAAWVACKTKDISLSLTGILKELEVPNSSTITGAPTLAAYLTTQLVADATTGFGGVTVTAVEDPDTGDYKLVLTTLQEGDTVRLVVNAATDDAFGFGAGGSQVEGQTFYGFGYYYGYDVLVPFASFPDPDGILARCELDSDFADSITVALNLGTQGVQTLSATGAFERNSYQRPTTAAKASLIIGTGGGETVDVSAYSPFTYKEAADNPPELFPWDPVGGQATKFWNPGTCATGYVASATGATIARITVADGAPNPSNASELHKLHGSGGNLSITTVVNAMEESITLVDAVLTVNLTAAAHTFDDFKTLWDACIADSTHAIYGLFAELEIVETGTVLEDVINFYDPNMEPWPIPDLGAGDRYIAAEDFLAAGWTKDRIYEYNGVDWDETSPVEWNRVICTEPAPDEYYVWNPLAGPAAWVQGAADQENVAAGATAYFTTGGIDPIEFDATAGVAQLMGKSLYLTTDTLDQLTELWISVDGSPLQKFAWPADLTMDDILSNSEAVPADGINDRFGFNGTTVGAMHQAVGATRKALKLLGAEKGREGTIYIAKCTNAGKLFAPTEPWTIVADDITVAADHTNATIDDTSLVYALQPGDVLTQGSGDDLVSATIMRVAAAGANTVKVWFATPFEGLTDAVTTVLSHLASGDYIRKHHGVPYDAKAGDGLWEAGGLQAVIAGTQNITTAVGAVDFGECCLELSEVFSITESFSRWYIRAEAIPATDGEDAYPDPELLIDTVNDTVEIRNEAAVNVNGESYTGIGLKLYAGFAATRLDLTRQYLSRYLSFATVDDILEYGPIDPRNELIFGVWAAKQGMANETRKNIPIKALGVEGDTLADWQNITKVTEKNRSWMFVPLTADVDINQWFGDYVEGSMAAARKKDWCCLLSFANPTESYADTVGTAAAGASNQAGAVGLKTFAIDLDKLNLAAAFAAHTPTPIDPDAVTEESGLYLRVSGGGATATESALRWLIASVNAAENKVTVTIDPAEGLNDDNYYATALPPLVALATLTIYERGSAITEADDKGTALQAYMDYFGCRKVSMFPSDGYDAVDYNGANVRLANYFGTACVGGYIQTHSIMNPVAGWPLPWLNHAYGTNDTYDEVETIMGLSFVVNDDSDTYCFVCMDYTTDVSDSKNHRFTVNAQLDSLAFRIRDGVAHWRRYNVSDKTLDNLYAQVEAAGAATKAAFEIKTFEVDVVEIGAPATVIEGADEPVDEESITIVGHAESFRPLGRLPIYIYA